MTSAPAIGFEYRPSNGIRRLLVAITCTALVSVLLSGVPLIAAAALFILIAASCWHAVSGLHVPICAVGWTSQGGWTVRGLDGADDAAILLSHRVLSRAILLRLMSVRYGRLTLWLTPDNSDADTRRRLRMRLAIWNETDTETH